MDHSEAINKQAVERYVLGDLTVSEVEEFERHFFDCPQCSEELRIASVFLDNARAVFIEQGLRPAIASLPASAREAGWWQSFEAWWRQPWAAATAMVAVIAGVFAIYQGLVIAPKLRHRLDQLSSAQTVTAFPLYAASRGEPTVISPPANALFYTLYFDKTWDSDFPSYRASLRDDPGAVERFAITVPAPQPGRSINVLTPVRTPAAGKYVLVMQGVDASGRETEVARFPFTLRFE